MRQLPAVTVVGIVFGLQFALEAVGIVLIYRASRFINFAQGQMGALAASTLAVLVLQLHVPYWIALAAAVVVGGLTGAAIERLLGWRLFEKSRLALMVATIGVAQLILLAIIKGPFHVDPGRLTRKGFPEPFKLHWHFEGVTLTGSHVTTLIVGPLIAVGLSLFLKRTRAGKAIRGAASNPDAARLAGISVRRVSLLVWVLAGLVSALAAILFAPSQTVVTFGDSGTSLLLGGLAAALVAGMDDFRLAFAAGIALGIVEQLALFYTSVAGLADVSVAAVLVVALVVRARVLGRDVSRHDGLVTDESRPALPERVRNVFVFRHAGRIGWIALFAVLAVAPLVHGLQTQERAVFLLLMVSYAMAGLGLTVLTGWAGQLSLGQFAFLGVGAFAASYLDRHNVGLPVMLLAAGLAAAAVSVLVGLVAVRFRGVFLGVVTLAFAFVARSWLFRQSWLTQDSGAVVHVKNVHLFGMRIHTVRGAYAVGVVVLALAVLALHSLRRSGVGRAIIAVRDNDDLAASYGLTPVGVKLMALAVAGFITGIGGGLWGMAQGNWSFTSFDPTMSLVILSCVIVGGAGTLAGPLLGTIAVFAWPYLVANADTLAIRSFTSGILLLIALLFIPGGLTSLLDRARQRLIEAFARHAPELPDLELRPVTGARPLEVQNLSLAFGGIKAVDGVSIKVEPDEIVGLIGGNGAGKTTVINCISGHLRPDAGLIKVYGQDMHDLGPEFRPVLGLSRTFQDARLFPGLTVQETVMAAMDRSNRSGAVGALLAAPWVRRAEREKGERAGEILASFGLADRANSLTGELSTGMRRICDLAATVAASPSLVLLDEPTAGLAQREAEAFAPLVRDLRDRHGCSLLIVEHDMPILMSLCDRIYCLEEGQVIAEGTPEEILANARVIASYLGAEPSADKRSNGSGTRRRASRARGVATPAGSRSPNGSGGARAASKEGSR